MKRFRRTKINPRIRNLVQDVYLDVKDFIYPLFVVPGKNIKKESEVLEGIYQMSIDKILDECEELISLGIYNVILFGVVDIKDSIGSSALDSNSLIAKCIKSIKEKYPEIMVVSDLCFCEYTDHGHCGVLDCNDILNNDKTLELLAKQALVHAKSGVDMIAPSGVIDGTIKALRNILDANGFENLPIMSYSTKFASAFYDPFRDLADSSPSFGDRKSYQMDFRDSKQAISRSISDEEDGADILMVKPAMTYLDIVSKIKNSSSLPLAVYNVSGEYMMMKSLMKNSIEVYERTMMELMYSFKRAGADIIISYHAKEVADIMRRK
ncbi:MAG: Porphobilinogen synthase (EC [uncultured Campylobacterales bacterium]|uniref:Delta-aminolevulinic acid dehydratase n=1 Tax=uncultured Campylobacterales bacterium TaxID=352960 RepID=A0A6S6S8P7_9BACT|nr:MAG: Porphobilinogen synthase (EC [uncultured Campylobacterales bacterium]